MLLSIVISGKNDNFRENNSQVLKLNLEQTVKNIKNLNLDDVEIILCDWGSEKKIVDEIFVEKHKSFKCIYVSPEIAEKYNDGCSYSYVHPHNTASRRSKGKYIIFWDSDTIIMQNDFKNLYDFIKNMDLNEDLDSFYWASRKNIEYEQYKNIKTSDELKNYLDSIPEIPNYNMLCGENNSFGGTGVALLVSKKIWEDCTGLWEKLVHRGWADIEIHNRLLVKYNFCGDLANFGVNFYHLNYPCHGPKVNPHINSMEFKCNPPSWGLIDEKLQIIE